MNCFLSRLLKTVHPAAAGWTVSALVHAGTATVLLVGIGAWNRERAKSYGSREAVTLEVTLRGSIAQKAVDGAEVPVTIVSAVQPKPVERQPTKTVEHVADQKSKPRTPEFPDGKLPPPPAETRKSHEPTPEIDSSATETQTARQLASIAAPNVVIVAPEFVGGDASNRVKPLTNRPPIYPDPAIRDRLEGTIVLRLTIASDGRVTNVEITRSSTHSILDAAAVRAARSWRFEPAREFGVAVESVESQEIRFELK
jgi:protein TonB